MSPIGRIFSVLNLVLAAVFLGWASNNLATSHNFKKQFEEEQGAHDATKQEKDAEIAKLRTEKQQAETNAGLFREEREREQLRADQAESDRTNLERESAELRASVTKISESLENYNTTNSRLQEDKDRAIAAQREAENERDAAQDAQAAAETAQREAEEVLAEARRQIGDLEILSTSLEKEKSSLESKLATLVDVTNVSLDTITAQPLIEGAVVQAMYDVGPGLVALNVGSNDDVQRGMTFEIYNGNTYKGQVRVESVHDNMSTALIKRTMPGQTIRQGDRAATRL